MRSPGVGGAGDESGDRPGVLVIDHVDGRSRSAVAAVRALAAGGFRPYVAVSRRRSSAAVSRDCAGVVRVDAPGSAGSSSSLSRRLEDLQLIALPASDAAVTTLDLPGGHLIDKAVLPARAKEAGLAMPPTTRLASVAALAAAADDIQYPAIVKAAVKLSAGAVARRVDSAAEVHALASHLDGAIVVQPFLTGGLTAVAGVVHDGRLLAAVHQSYQRIWPRGCGVASAAVTTVPDLDLEARMLRLLDGHNGVFQAQFLDGFLIDVNPRAYGSMSLAVGAGANLPAIACAAVLGRADALVRGRAGVRYRWLEGDVRHLVDAVRTGELGWRRASRELVPRRGTIHSIESVRDPAPAVVRVVEALAGGR